MELNISEIEKAVKGKIVYNSGDIPKIKNIITDSRAAMPDSLFFAVKGGFFDGHDFIEQAIENGAVGAVAQKNNVKRIDLHGKNAALIAVNDTIKALSDAAKYYKSLLKKLTVTVGITGSVGKTITKEFMYSVLAQKYKTQKNDGNKNNEIGLPMTVFSLGEGTEAVVLEMGMSDFGEIRGLSKTVNPDIAAITNIGTAHIAKLGSKEGIKKAKFEILEGMDKNSAIILNADDPLLYAEKNKTGKKEYFFGIQNNEAGFKAENTEVDFDTKRSFFTLENYRYTLPAPGIHYIYNALPAIAAGKIYGLSDEKIQAGLYDFKNVKMRQDIYEFNGITIIDDCYNASLESVNAALETLSKINKNKKIAVLSDILETGGFANEIHKKIGEAALEYKIDKIFVCGEKSKLIFDFINDIEKCVYFGDKSDIAKSLVCETQNGGAVLFKASRGMALETVIEDFKKLF